MSLRTMLAETRRVENLTIASVRDSLMGVDGNLAARAAQVIEEENMRGFSRDERIAVFLAGLMANLVNESKLR